MSIRSAIFAAAALLATANAHIIMDSPVPYSNDKIDNSPLSGAAQFPCKAQNGFTVTKMNPMKVGEKQQVSFKGTAVHGGGSCQLSYTQDTTPTANSKFKVITSIEGGCPGVDGKTNQYDFTLPDSIPNGKGTFAWTWFSKQAGQPELYMNCAPIDVTGGASDASKLAALPDMLVANMASINTCKQVENKAIKFPSPGKTLIDGGLGDAVAPTGQCGASSGGGDSSPAPSSGGASKPTSAAGSQPSSAAGSKPTSVAGSQPTSAAGSQPTSAAGIQPSSAAAAQPSSGGGIFAPSASSAASAEPTASSSPDTEEPTASSSPDTEEPAASSSPDADEPAATSVAGAKPSATSAAGGASPSATGTPSTGGSSSGGSTSCSSNGAIVCNGTSKFGLCDNGQVVWQAVASGTKCENGKISKRSYNGRIVRATL